MNETENNKITKKHLESMLSSFKNQKIIVSDGDETISISDATKNFFVKNNLEQMWIKNREIFNKNGRNFISYSQVAKLYSQIPYPKYKNYCENILDNVHIRDYWKDVLETGYQIIIITSGLKYLWEYIAKQNNWSNVIVIGGNNYNEQDFIITPQTKGTVVEILKSNNNQILAFGDSKVDLEMLKKSDIGIVVANERFSPGLLEELQDEKNIFQLKEKFFIKNEKIELLSIEDIIKKFSKLK